MGMSQTFFILLLCHILCARTYAGCSEICSWFPWGSWTSCPCGTGVQNRSRALCCEIVNEYTTIETCAAGCGLNVSDSSENSDCNSSYCENGGTLQEDGHSCICIEGYEDHCCQSEIDECASLPCKNGATCIDWINAFSCECPTGFYGEFCETGICQPSVADIVFVLDSSVSQTEQNFKRQLEFINDFIDHVAIGENDQQVAVVTYSTEARTEILLGQYVNKTDLQLAVSNITFTPGATFTDKGLEAAMNVFDSSGTTRIYGNTAKRYVIVLTDGMSYDRQKTEEAATELKNVVNKVLAVGIGVQVSHTELLAIASSDDEDLRKFVFSVHNFNALYTIVKQLVHLTCEECLWRTSSDVVFLVDASYLMPDQDFQISLNAVTYLTNKIKEIETANSTTRLSLVTYSVNVHPHRLLNNTKTKEAFLVDLQKVSLHEDYCSAAEQSCASSFLMTALKYVRNGVFDDVSRNNNDSRKIIVLVTSGNEPVDGEVVSELEALKEAETSLLVIASGSTADVSNLQLLTGDPALVFSIVEEDDLTALDALVEEFFFASCNLTEDFTNTD